MRMAKSRVLSLEDIVRLHVPCERVCIDDCPREAGEQAYIQSYCMRRTAIRRESPSQETRAFLFWAGADGAGHMRLQSGRTFQLDGWGLYIISGLQNRPIACGNQEKQTLGGR